LSVTDGRPQRSHLAHFTRRPSSKRGLQRSPLTKLTPPSGAKAAFGGSDGVAPRSLRAQAARRALAPPPPSVDCSDPCSQISHPPPGQRPPSAAVAAIRTPHTIWPTGPNDGLRGLLRHSGAQAATGDSCSTKSVWRAAALSHLVRRRTRDLGHATAGPQPSGQRPPSALVDRPTRRPAT
jgi:hypothetical protein